MKKVLVENHFSNYSILIEKSCSAVIRQAAEQLVFFVKKVCGCQLNIKTEIQNGEKVISLGDTYKRSRSSKKTLKFDGFIIEVIEDNIYIFSKTDLGVLYGVYDMLERFFGVKFLTADYTYIPTKTNVYIDDDFYICSNPSIEWRVFLSYDIMNNPQFASRMRMNHEWLDMPVELGGAFSLINGKSHTMFDLVSKDYYKEHPEWFYEKNGKLMDICYSHAGLNLDGSIDETLEISPVKIAVDNFLKQLLAPENEKYKYFMIGQQDTAGILEKCECDECLWQVQYYGRSGMLIRFVNAIDNAVRKYLQDAGIEREFYIVTFAYLWSQKAPFDFATNKPLHPSVIPNKNVYVRLAPIESKNYWGLFEKGQSYWTREMFATWPKLTKNLMAWTYTVDYGGYFIYYPTARHWADDLKYMAKHNFKYVMFQAAFNEKNVLQDKINTYIASKLMWNPALNVDELRNEFIDFYFGKVSQYIKDFFNCFDEHYKTILTDTTALDINLSTRIGSSLLNSKLHNLDFWEKQLNILEKAKNQAYVDNSNEQEHFRLLEGIDQAYLILQYMIGMRYDEYYPNQKDEKCKFLQAFINNCKNLGVEKCTEGLTVDKLSEKLGVGNQINNMTASFCSGYKKTLVDA